MRLLLGVSLYNKTTITGFLGAISFALREGVAFTSPAHAHPSAFCAATERPFPSVTEYCTHHFRWSNGWTVASSKESVVCMLGATVLEVL